MSLTSDSKPSGSGLLSGERQREAAQPPRPFPEGGAPDSAGQGIALPRARSIAVTLPERYAELRASGLVCGRW